MAKQSVLQREKKRESLITMYQIKRNAIKKEWNNVASFQDRVTFYKKFERKNTKKLLPTNAFLKRICIRSMFTN